MSCDGEERAAPAGGCFRRGFLNSLLHGDAGREALMPGSWGAGGVSHGRTVRASPRVWGSAWMWSVA